MNDDALTKKEKQLDQHRPLPNEAEPKADKEKLLKIGQLAKQVGERNSTIRHWTKEGLLKVTEITDAGYQLYAADMIERVEKIHALKKKRYTLREIKQQIK